MIRRLRNKYFKPIFETSIKFVFVVFVLTGMVSIAILLTFDSGNISTITSMAMVQKADTPIYKIQTNDMVCSLTFDCAWTADDIQQILDTLKKEDVKASFFAVGLWAQKNPEAVRLIVKEGHDISGHGFTHLKFTALEKGRAREELKNFRETVSGILGKSEWNGSDLFRAPYGDWNKNVVQLAAEEGLYTIQWSADTIDYKPDATKSFILEKINTKLSPGGIILMHTGTKLTASILGDVIKDIKAKGYKFLPTSKLIYKENYRIDAQGTQILKK